MECALMIFFPLSYYTFLKELVLHVVVNNLMNYLCRDYDIVSNKVFLKIIYKYKKIIMIIVERLINTNIYNCICQFKK